MNLKQGLSLGWFGLTTVLFKRTDPLVGSVIVTDRCNLSCRHCAVANLTAQIYPWEQIRRDMAALYRDGVRILLFYGGEPFLWHDQGRLLRDLVREARRMGFFRTAVVTNGTMPLDAPEADLIFVSLDGLRARHDFIRGATFDLILHHIDQAPSANICLYMAVNRFNHNDVEDVCRLAQRMPQVSGFAFNFHTPYPGVESMALSRAQKETVCRRLGELKREGLPVLNLVSAFPDLIDPSGRSPCPQCVVAENGRRWICGRCSEIPGLCRECGFAFAAEFSLVFSGHPRAVTELLSTYLRGL